MSYRTQTPLQRVVPRAERSLQAVLSVEVPHSDADIGTDLDALTFVLGDPDLIMRTWDLKQGIVAIDLVIKHRLEHVNALHTELRDMMNRLTTGDDVSNQKMKEDVSKILYETEHQLRDVYALNAERQGKEYERDKIWAALLQAYTREAQAPLHACEDPD